MLSGVASLLKAAFLFRCLEACFLKIWPLVTGLKLFEEFVNGLSELFTSTSFRLTTMTLSSSGAEPVSSLKVLSAFSIEPCDSIYCESTLVRIPSRPIRSSKLDTPSLASISLIRSRLADSIRFLTVSNSSFDRIVELSDGSSRFRKRSLDLV